jgi:hypothetical protein
MAAVSSYSCLPKQLFQGEIARTATHATMGMLATHLFTQINPLAGALFGTGIYVINNIAQLIFERLDIRQGEGLGLLLTLGTPAVLGIGMLAISGTALSIHAVGSITIGFLGSVFAVTLTTDFIQSTYGNLVHGNR